MLGLALQNYHDVFGRFPPAFIADESGKPMHSWRVLVLRIVDKDLYQRYDFSEPWDGPTNRRLWKEMPRFFRCPSYRGQNPYSTNYLAVVDPTTAWPGVGALAKGDIADGASRTVMLVEIADSNIIWMEPRDMTLAEATAGVNADRQHGISSNHRDGARALLADGSDILLPSTSTPEAIRAWLTISGGEPRNVLSAATKAGSSK